MNSVKIILAALFALLVAVPSFAKEQEADTSAVRTDAVRAFEQILDLWRAGDFGRLYDKTLVSGKDTKESFTRKMSSARLKPSCCWEKMQDVTVSIKTPSSVVLKAKLGLDAPGEMEFKTKSFKLLNEFGEWRIARSELLSLAEVGKGKKSRNHKVKTIN